jgi:hypothetical protein
MAEKIETAERKAIATAEVTEELSGDTLVHEFKALEAGGDAAVEEKLLALKAQMGLLPSGEPEEPKALEAGDEEPIQEAEIVDVAGDEGEAEAGEDAGSDELEDAFGELEAEEAAVSDEERPEGA